MPIQAGRGLVDQRTEEHRHDNPLRRRDGSSAARRVRVAVCLRAHPLSKKHQSPSGLWATGAALLLGAVPESRLERCLQDPGLGLQPAQLLDSRVAVVGPIGHQHLCEPLDEDRRGVSPAARSSARVLSTPR
jgi:hypothetical protein